MENKLMIFENEAFGKVRTLNLNGEPWFVAADVCKALELGNPSMTVERLDDDEKGISTIDTLGGKQRMAIINEPGLYSLVITSRKPEAKAFKRWITHEVIPAIRKHGVYITDEKLKLFAEHGADEVLLEEQQSTGQHGGECPVQHRRLPFDEGLIVENQSHSTEHGNDHQADPEHVVDLAMLEPDPGDLAEGGRDGNSRGDVDTGELEGREEQDDGEEIEEKFHG